MTNHSSSLNQLYSKELQSVLQALEANRVQLRQRVQRTALGVVPVFVILGFLLLQWVGAFVGLMIASALLFYVFHRPFQAYRKQFKHQVIQRLVKHYKPDLIYNAAGGIPKEEFVASKIYTQSVDRYHCEDLLRGKIGATLFRLSEVHAEHKSKDDMETIFSGLFFVASFNKSFNSHTIVLSDVMGQVFGISKRPSNQAVKASNRPGERVDLEDPVFNQFFTVYSTDQVEARYILSTSLMQRLVEFLNFHDGRPTSTSRMGVKLAFIRSKVYISIPLYKSYFEPPSLFAKSAKVTFQEIQDYLADIKLAEDIIEDLNLNRRIWGKK